MESSRNLLTATLLLCAVVSSGAQEQQSTCYGGGSIAASVIITVLVILILLGAAYYAWRRYGKYKKGQHLILETDPEKGNEYVFDNPGFKDASLSPAVKEPEKTKVDGSANKNKWAHWSTLTSKNEKRKTQDDSVLNEQETKVVSLRSHDFTGLGFNICGNMRDGIYIKDILHHGPASESGKLTPGDRITSITINFENMVFDDALTILSYASPYEVTIEAKNGKLSTSHTNTSGQPNHPMYKSSSSMDLLQLGKSAKKRLFQAEDANEPPSPQKHDTSPKKPSSSSNKKAPQQPRTSILNTDQLKNQLEQKILEDHNENLRQKQHYDKTKIETSEVQRSSDGNKYQKFGIKVFPVEEQKSPKLAELSQNDNNINIEKNAEFVGVDEVDKKNGPPVKKREKKVVEEVTVVAENDVPDAEVDSFVRKGSLTSSGIRRDVNGIPQEIPNHMMNAAVAARRNRKNVEEKVDSTPKRQKGKAPAPPPEGTKFEDSCSSLDEIDAVDDQIKITQEMLENPPTPEVKTELKDYNSDSEEENTDNQSSVNTIELNSSDITVHHQAEEVIDEKQNNRRTASTGDLSKLQKNNRKTSTGTLERAQSLDITDTGMPVISKKRKGGTKSDEDYDSLKTSSGDSFYDDALINKEPRLSLILDGLNTFQRSRLKKSTEWGNLEDAILNLSNSPGSGNSYDAGSRLDFDSSSEFSPAKSAEFDALVNKINEIKQETSMRVELEDQELEKGVEELQKANKADDEIVQGADSSFVSDVLNAVSSFQVVPTDSHKEIINPVTASLTMLTSEREFCTHDFYPRKIEDDTNVSDDIKVSRHSLGSLERQKLPEIQPKPPARENISNISVTDKFVERKQPGGFETYNTSLNLSRDGDTSELYKTALDETLKNEDLNYGKVLISTPDLIKNVTIAEAIHDLNNEVTIEGPTSLTFEIPARPEKIESQIGGPNVQEITQSKILSNGSLKNTDNSKSPETKSCSLTYITEIQVLTPTLNKNVSEVEIIPAAKNLDSEFENYVKNFEVKMAPPPDVASTVIENPREFKLQRQKSIPEVKKIDVEKELSKIQEIAEEQLKKLPEMRFTTSSYEPSKIPEKRQSSQIELLRSNFEKSPPKPKPEVSIPTIKSRIPVATSKTPPTSPERRDSRTLDFEVDKDLIEIMTSGIHSTPKYQPPTPTGNKNAATSRNVTVTSIRNSKIPSGLPTYASRPPVPPRKSDSSSPDGEANVIQVSTNGSVESSSTFKQWVFNPTSADTTVTNITVTTDNNNKGEK